MSVIGECPHEDCGQTVWRILPDGPLPAFSHEECPECGKPVWMLYSRIDPVCFTEEQFAERYLVDEATKSIKVRSEARYRA